MAGAQSGKGPLAGRRVIELAGIGPAPYCGQLLADMGAEVILVDRPGPDVPTVDSRGKKSIVLNLKQPAAVEAVLKLVETADAIIEPFRPGVVERLGVGPKDCLARNPKIVYGRMTGWGQTGPWSSMAGHDINYISVTGALHAMGEAGRPPSPPLNVVGDYGGGSLFMAMGLLAGILSAEKTGKGDVVDVAIADGALSMIGILFSLDHQGAWTTARQSNMLDGGAPYYRCYETSDGKYMAVGCIEPQFFAEMLRLLELSEEAYGGQNDLKAWPGQHELLAKTFAAKTRDDWAAIFDGTDACVSPVLDYVEAQHHRHNADRKALTAQNGMLHPHPAPRFESVEYGAPAAPVEKGADTEAILGALGVDVADVT